MKTQYCFLIFGLILSSYQAQARIEYALTNRIVTCTACHVSPFGGGPRYLDGKLFGSRKDEPSKLSFQDKWSLDARLISYYPEGGNESRQGTALMTTSVGANIPIKKNANGGEQRFVGVYSLGVVQQGPRDIYGQWMSKARTENPVYVQVGRFNIPFGLLTDEHRTYTKLLTRTEIFDYEIGASFSGDIKGGLHYDFAVTNGFQSGGTFNANTSAKPDATSATFGNVRWMPSFLPLLIGLSAGEHQRLPQYSRPVAVTAYAALSLDRLTKNYLSGSIMAEVVQARHWSDPAINPNINRYFIPAAYTAYVETVDREAAQAWLAQMDINLTNRLVFQYKYDRLTFVPRYTRDRFERNGVGLKYFVDANLTFWTRYEYASVGRSEIIGSNVFSEVNAFWAMMQLTL